VVNVEVENIKKLENYLLFTIKRKLQEEETSNCPEHSSYDKILKDNRMLNPSSSTFSRD